MTISRTLLIICTLTLNMHCSAYDASALNNETTQMLNFAQTLREVDNKQAFTIAQWLEQQVCDTSYNVQDYDIVAIASVITNDNLTIESKISVLSQIVANQKKEQVKKNINNIMNAAIVLAFFGGFATLLTVAIMEEMKNPTPKLRIYIEHKYPANHPFYQSSC